MEPKDTRSRPWLALMALAVVVWAGWLRLEGLAHARLLNCDESFYLMESRRITGQVQACRRIFEIYRRDRPVGMPKLSPAERKQIEALATQGYGQLGGRFGHDAMLATGVAAGLSEESVGPALAAVFGLATVALVGLWAGRLWDARAAVLAAALLGGSVVHVAYSRSTLCEADAVFFMVLCLFAYSRSVEGRRPRVWLVTAGLAFGCAFVTNLRSMPLFYALVLAEALGQPVRAWPGRLALFAGGALVAPVAAEAFYHVVFLFSGASGVLLTRQTYVHTLAWQFFRLKGGVMDAGANLGHYPAYLATVEGALFLSIAAVGAAWLLVRRQVSERPITAALVVLAAYWQLAVGFKCLRYVAPLFPLLALAGAGALAALSRRFDSRGLATGVLVVLFCGVATRACAPLAVPLPGYLEVARWLAASGGPAPKILATQASYFRLHFPATDVELVENLEDVNAARARGFRWYVECFQKYHWPVREQLLSLAQELERRGRPRVFPHPRAGEPWTWFEGGYRDIPVAWIADARQIRVWDLDEVFARNPVATPPPAH